MEDEGFTQPLKGYIKEDSLIYYATKFSQRNECLLFFLANLILGDKKKKKMGRRVLQHRGRERDSRVRLLATLEYVEIYFTVNLTAIPGSVKGYLECALLQHWERQRGISE